LKKGLNSKVNSSKQMERNSIPSVSMEISVSLTLNSTKMGEMFLAATKNSSTPSMAHENEL